MAALIDDAAARPGAAAVEPDASTAVPADAPAAASAPSASHAETPREPADPTAPIGLVDVIDRDGQVRQSVTVHRWPLRIGRALDNDLVLSDPHVAAHHLVISPGPDGLAVTVGDTCNGVHAGSRLLLSGEQGKVVPHGDAVELTAGRSRLRLRLPTFPLAAELPLAMRVTGGTPRLVPLLLAAAALGAGLVFTTYLQNDPDDLPRALGAMLLSAIAATAVWCSAWALLSKTFTRQAQFGWHLRVFVFAALGLLAADALPGVLAFAFSWPAATDFAFVAAFAVGATGFYFHLLAVEPARHRLLKWVAATGAIVGIALTLWFNLQRTDGYGDELYMSHLYPPGLRLVRPAPTDAFITGLAALKPVLDRKAHESGHGDDAGTTDDDDE